MDLSLEQSYNRDAASAMKGIMAFRNSEGAVRRWALIRSQTTMAVTELRSICGLEHDENALAQVLDCRIRKHSKHVHQIALAIEDFGNPFACEFEVQPLMNLASGKSALANSSKYLLETLKQGKEARENFVEESEKDPSRFLRPIKRIKIENYAAESTKSKVYPSHSKDNSGGLRDVFARFLVVVAEGSCLDLPYFLSFPITEFPMALALPDGTLLKIQKAKLLNKLEDLQRDVTDELDCINNYYTHHIFDVGLLLHSILSITTTGTTFGSIVRNILASACSSGVS